MTQVPQHLKDECQAELERCHAIATAAYPDADIPLPTIAYTQRGRTAGSYSHMQKLIKINPILLIENVREMVDNTVSHEFAHCADVSVHGVQYGAYNPRTGRQKRIVHGPTFKAFQRLFGRSDATFHNMDTSNAQVRRKAQYVYVCNGCKAEVILGPVRHKKQQARARYTHRCRSADKSLTLKGKKRQVKRTVAVAAQAPAPAPTRPAKTGLSNKALAVLVYREHPARADFIREMVARGVKKTTASTYHHNVNSGKWT